MHGKPTAELDYPMMSLNQSLKRQNFLQYVDVNIENEGIRSSFCLPVFFVFVLEMKTIDMPMVGYALSLICIVACVVVCWHCCYFRKDLCCGSMDILCVT